jgi:hypothetical protein
MLDLILSTLAVFGVLWGIANLNSGTSSLLGFKSKEDLNTDMLIETMKRNIESTKQ